MKKLSTLAFLAAAALGPAFVSCSDDGPEPGSGKQYGIQTVKIPAGTFQMGSPADEPGRYSYETQHWVKLTRGFRMSKHEITNTQYAAFLNAKSIGSDGKGSVTYYAGGSQATETQTFIYASSGSYDWGLHWETDKWVPVSGKEKHPVIYVTWYGAVAYAAWVGGSLSTEAQWEYACRGGKSASLPFGIGTGKKLTGAMANFYSTYPYDLDNATPGGYNDGTQSGYYMAGTTAVGSYSSYRNGYGLYDMHGNVYEWCLDQWDGSNNYPTTTTQADPQIDPLVITGPYRVLRGGYWGHNAEYCRSAYRYYGSNAGYANDDVGFRVVFLP